jgi:predicted metal-dependent peptidase
MSEETETKLSAARTRLILDKPFLGALVLRLPMIEGNPSWCKTTGTDARNIYYNENYIQELSLDQTQFVLAHEALHCALSHFSRRHHRVKHRWDLACDLAINPSLINEGLVPSSDAFYMDEYEGMTAEEIYPMLDELEDQETMDQHLYDDTNQDESQDESQNNSGSGDQQQERDGNQSGQAELDKESGGAPQPKPLNTDEIEQLSVQWRQRMAGAAQQAMQAGKMSGALARLIDHLLQPQLPWRMLLARYMTAMARNDYNYTRPSRREGNAILPSLRSSQVDVVVVVDTSSSISNTEIDEFMSEELHCIFVMIACLMTGHGSMKHGMSLRCQRISLVEVVPVSSQYSIGWMRWGKDRIC